MDIESTIGDVSADAISEATMITIPPEMLLYGAFISLWFCALGTVAIYTIYVASSGSHDSKEDRLKTSRELHESLLAYWSRYELDFEHFQRTKKYQKAALPVYRTISQAAALASECSGKIKKISDEKVEEYAATVKQLESEIGDFEYHSTSIWSKAKSKYSNAIAHYTQVLKKGREALEVGANATMENYYSSK